MKTEQWLIHLVLPLAVCAAIAGGWLYPEYQHYQILRQSAALVTNMQQCELAKPETLPSADVRQVLNSVLPDSDNRIINPHWQNLAGGIATSATPAEWGMESTGTPTELAHTLLAALQLSPTIHLQSITLDSQLPVNSQPLSTQVTTMQLQLRSFPQ